MIARELYGRFSIIAGAWLAYYLVMIGHYVGLYDMS